MATYAETIASQVRYLTGIPYKRMMADGETKLQVFLTGIDSKKFYKAEIEYDIGSDLYNVRLILVTTDDDYNTIVKVTEWVNGWFAEDLVGIATLHKEKHKWIVLD